MKPLWLAIELPHLALNLFSRSDARCRDWPLAVVEQNKRGQSIKDCNPVALRAGIKPGMTANAALGLEQTLRLVPRKTDQEHQALERLAGWCYQYSSQVAPLPERDVLLLEIAASRRLFGSAETLGQRLSKELQLLGFHSRYGSAPTQEGAILAARYNLHMENTAELHARFGKLPVDSLYPGIPETTALEKMGFRWVSEILRLPRKALARRLGTNAVDYLDRLTGARPDPVRSWQPPEHFSSSMDMVSEVTSSQALLFPLRRLVSELCGVLRARDCGVQTLHVLLHSDRGEAQQQHLKLGLQQPARSEEHILLLLRERLERLSLSAPVCRITLEAKQLLPFDAHQDGLFQEDPDLSAQPLRPLLERLQARLGNKAVSGLNGVQDHRPEYSWAERKLDEPVKCTALPHRPVWLFNRPQRCRIEEYRVLAGPERIEAGWWDGHDCRRDYFVVRDNKGSTLWAFREYKPQPGWYLQGMFS